jgi:hypothetical protein
MIVLNYRCFWQSYFKNIYLVFENHQLFSKLLLNLIKNEAYIFN